MSQSTRSSAIVIVTATVVGLLMWASWRLLGVDLTVRTGQETSQVGAVDVLVTALLAGLAAWGVYAVLARRARTARWWPFVGSTAIAVSVIGPSWLSDGIAAVALISMHLAVGCMLVFGFARFVPLRGSAGVEHDS